MDSERFTLGHFLRNNKPATGSQTRRGVVHLAALALVWLTFAASGFVFSEPCPTDALTLLLMVMLPVIGLVRVTPQLAFLLLVLVGAASSAILATTAAYGAVKAITHTMVTLYLYGATVVLAGFVAVNPLDHTRLIFRGWMVAAVLATLAGIAGYFDLVPNADMLTKFGRATGTFKDPNVFGPFLVPPFLYAIHTALNRPAQRAAGPLLLAGVLALGVLLSFSRGAWMNLLAGLVVYIVMAFVTAETNRYRWKIAGLVILSVVLAGVMVGAALQVDKVADLLDQRASVAQSYDVGPDGRFGGQEKALALILDHPLGIGAAQFALRYHHEEAHNVYLSLPLNAGWLGAGLYMGAVGLTIVLGFAHCFKRTPAQPLLLIAYAAFLANAFEGVIIDTDHWRHFYVLMAMIWGIATAAPVHQFAVGRRPGRILAELQEKNIWRARPFSQGPLDTRIVAT